VINAIRNSTAEGYTLYGAVVSVLVAAVLTQIPALRFGSFWMMTGVLIGADLVLYLLMKVGVFKAPRDRSRSE
jgi:hypothetical protein